MMYLLFTTMLFRDVGTCLQGGDTLLSLGFKVAKNQTQLATLQTMQKVKFRTILMIH